MSLTDILEPEKDSEIELIKHKDFFGKRNLKGTPRTVEVRREYDNQNTIFLKKDGKVKETYFGIKTVSEVRHSESTNLIQLTSLSNELFFIRTKTKGSKDRWIRYLTTLAQNNEENIYEDPNQEPQPRLRSETADKHVVKPPKRSPREPSKVQSVVNSHLIRIAPTKTQEVLDALPKEEYDITASGAHGPSSTEEGPSSFRLYHHHHGPTTHIYDNTPHTASGNTVINVNINVEESRHQGPVPPRRNGSSISRVPIIPTREGVQCDERDVCRPERGSSQRQEKARKEGPTPTPRRFPVQPKELDCSEVITRREHRGADVWSSQPDCRHRRTGRDWSREVEDHTPALPLSSTAEEESLYANVSLPGIYVVPKRRMSDDLKREQKDGTITHSIDRQQLLKIRMKTMSSGRVWIKRVPDDLKGTFYQGDRIVNINEQRIFDETFARNIIETSEREKVKITVARLVKGHIIDMERTSAGDPLGFQLNGTQITTVSPGTPFARQLAAAAMADVMCITHINDEYVPLRTNKNQVNLSLRDAGLSFFIILQPLDFMSELTGHS